MIRGFNKRLTKLENDETPKIWRFGTDIVLPDWVSAAEFDFETFAAIVVVNGVAYLQGRLQIISGSHNALSIVLPDELAFLTFPGSSAGGAFPDGYMNGSWFVRAYDDTHAHGDPNMIGVLTLYRNAQNHPQLGLGFGYDTSYPVTTHSGFPVAMFLLRQ